MTAPALSPAEAAAVARFDAAPYDEASAVERVARAIYEADPDWFTDLDAYPWDDVNVDHDWFRALAAAALAAMSGPVSDAEAAVRRVEALLAEGDDQEWNGATHNSRLRAALRPAVVAGDGER